MGEPAVEGHRAVEHGGEAVAGDLEAHVVVVEEATAERAPGLVRGLLEAEREVRVEVLVGSQDQAGDIAVERAVTG